MKRLPRIDRDDLGIMMRLTWPALMENLLITLVSFVDTAMVGGLGANATASVAVTSTPMWLFNGLVMAISVGGTALVARMVGAGDRDGAESACQQVFLGILLLSTILCAIVMAIAGQVPIWMQSDPVLHKDAADYMRIVAIGFIPNFTGVALGAVLRGAGDTKTPMRLAMAANLLNVVGNYLLIFSPRTIVIAGLSIPMWGAGMGVQGAALSTAISTILSGVLMVVLITRPKSVLRLKLRGIHPDMGILRRILRVGIPTAMERLTINIGQIFFVGMIASLGTVELAAHHLSITVESLSYMPGFAFGIAATTLVGQALGANDPQTAKRRGNLAIGSGVLVMSAIGIALFLFAPTLIALLTPSEPVRIIGASLIRICALEQPFMALNQVGAGALRGAGDTKMPFYVSLIGMWGVRLALAWLLAIRLGLGVNGAWIAMVADLAVRGTLMGLRFARGKWVDVRV